MSPVRGRKKKERSFSPADLKLYYESPFASWMEQFHRDQPDNGIRVDLIATGYGTASSEDPTKNKEFIQQLLDAGNQVVIISNDDHEPARQLKTVNAMRAGANYIFNGHLSVLPLIGSVDMMVRTDGPSRLGEYHYTPAQFFYLDPALTDLPIELCCFVDMLEQLQGVRPEDFMQITQPNSESPHIARLPCDGYMFDYRKVKISFRKSQMEFDADAMPDPSESRHWGRWSSYARKVLTRKARDNPSSAA